MSCTRVLFYYLKYCDTLGYSLVITFHIIKQSCTLTPLTYQAAKPDFVVQLLPKFVIMSMLVNGHNMSNTDNMPFQ